MVVNVKLLADKARAAIKRVQRALLNLEPAWAIVGMDLVRSVQANFDAQGRPTAWKPWSPKYAAWRAKKKPGKILTLNSRLRNSITSAPDSRGVDVGTNVVYGPIHQYGGKAGRGRAATIPARPYLVAQEDDMARVATTVDRYVSDRWGS